MATDLNKKSEPQAWTAVELRAMSAQERDAILESAAQAAASEYASNPALNVFNAFGPGDLYGESSSSTPR